MKKSHIKYLNQNIDENYWLIKVCMYTILIYMFHEWSEIRAFVWNIVNLERLISISMRALLNLRVNAWSLNSCRVWPLRDMDTDQVVKDGLLTRTARAAYLAWKRFTKQSASWRWTYKMPFFTTKCAPFRKWVIVKVGECYEGQKQAL